MTTASITVMTCDRCGDQAELRRRDQGYEWAAINYSEMNGPRWIGSQRSAKPQWADLCPDCSRELHDWFRAGQAS